MGFLAFNDETGDLELTQDGHHLIDLGRKAMRAIETCRDAWAPMFTDPAERAAFISVMENAKGGYETVERLLADLLPSPSTSPVN